MIKQITFLTGLTSLSLLKDNASNMYYQDMKTLDEFIKEQFDGLDELIFLERFRMYSEQMVQERNGFIIDLDEVADYVGFFTKGSAKRLLVSKFERNVDYQISIEPSSRIVNMSAKIKNSGITQVAQTNNAGRKTENILMTCDAFKEFCLLASTVKAGHIRKYFIKLENAIFEYLRYEKSILKRMLGENRRTSYPMGDAVYVIQYGKRIKVGGTNNMNNRVHAYRTHSIEGKLVFYVMCHTYKILEDSVHHKLRNYCFEDRKDWFTIDIHTAIEIVKKTQIELDHCPMLPSCSDTKQIVHEFPENVQDPNEEPQESITIEEVDDETEDTEDDKESIVKVDAEKEQNEVKVVAKTPLNIDKFLDECYIVDPKAKANWIEVTARYRLWSRNTYDYRTEILSILKEKGYKEGFIYDPESKVNYSAIQGLSMKPLQQFKISKNPTELERFLKEKCVSSVTGRISCKQLAEEFITWKNDPEYTEIAKQDKKDLNTFCNKNFLASTVHCGDRIRFGFYGISFKDIQHVGKKMKHKNRKAIEQVDMESGEVVNTFESITHASAVAKVSIAAISVAVSANKACKGFYYRLKGNTATN